MVFVVTSISDCVSKSGKTFFRLALTNEETQQCGEYVTFSNQFKVDDRVAFIPVFAYQYGHFQWMPVLTKVGADYGKK